MKNLLYLILLPGLIAFTACGRREPAPGDDGLNLADSVEVVHLPDGLEAPSDLPPCPGLLGVEEATGDRRNGSLRLLSSQRAAALAEFYTEHLAAHGWVMASSFRQGKEEHLQFRQGVRFLRLQIAPAPGRGRRAGGGSS